MVKEEPSGNNEEKDYRKGLDSGIQTYKELNSRNYSQFKSPTYGIEWDDSTVDTSTSTEIFDFIIFNSLF